MTLLCDVQVYGDSTLLSNTFSSFGEAFAILIFSFQCILLFLILHESTFQWVFRILLYQSCKVRFTAETLSLGALLYLLLSSSISTIFTIRKTRSIKQIGRKEYNIYIYVSMSLSFFYFTITKIIL